MILLDLFIDMREKTSLAWGYEILFCFQEKSQKTQSTYF